MPISGCYTHQQRLLKIMTQRIFMLLVVSGAMLLASGCKSLFPSSSTTVNSRWKNYSEVSGTFDKIQPYNTDSRD